MSTKKDASKSALIVAPPGRLRDSLGALLTSARQIQQVDSADEGDKALTLLGLQDFAWPIIDPKGFCAGFDGKRSLFKAKTLFARP